MWSLHSIRQLSSLSIPLKQTLNRLFCSSPLRALKAAIIFSPQCHWKVMLLAPCLICSHYSRRNIYLPPCSYCCESPVFFWYPEDIPVYLWLNDLPSMCFQCGPWIKIKAVWLKQAGLKYKVMGFNVFSLDLYLDLVKFYFLQTCRLRGRPIARFTNYSERRNNVCKLTEEGADEVRWVQNNWRGMLSFP